MKRIEWSEEKNKRLKRERGVSFEDVVAAYTLYGPLDMIPHPNQRDYPHQHLIIIRLNDYVYAVPFIYDEEKIFLKTVIPSRKYTKYYLNL